MQTIYPTIGELQRRLRSKRQRRKMGRKAVIRAKERLWLSEQKHKSTPGFANYP